MKTFEQFVMQKNEAGLSNFMPNMGQRAIPVNQGSPQAGPQQVSLSQFAGRIKDPNWQSLYQNFTRQHQTHGTDPKVQQLGQALHQAATTGNMSMLQPFAQQQVHAQPVR